MSDRLFIVGPGRMGLALGHALWQTETVESLVYCGRRPEPPSHPLFTQGKARYVFGLERPPDDVTALILAVPDDILSEIAVALSGHGKAPTGASVFHLSGALGTDPLAPLHAQGYPVGTIHPFQTVAHPITGADLLPGSYFAISGEPQALSTARRMVAALGSRSFTVPVSQRPFYHVAGVFASNYLLAVLSAASRFLDRAGIPEDEAMEALLPLVRGTLRNLEELGARQALTGPVARGDAETVHLHLRMLEGRDRSLYAALGRELLEALRPAGLNADVAEQMEDLFERLEEPRARGMEGGGGERPAASDGVPRPQEEGGPS